MKFLMLAVPITLAALISIYNIDALKHRYTVELKNDLTQASINNEIIEPRMARWQIAWQLFSQSPVIGYGSGTERRVLMEDYFDKRLYNSYLHKLNAHNQYLSIMLKTGIWGLLIFLFVLAYGYLVAWQNRDVLLAAFITLISFVSFSENIFDVNKTIFFYSFFFSLFIYSSRYTPDVAAIFKVKKADHQNKTF
jgi:O-antigen ligase